MKKNTLGLASILFLFFAGSLVPFHINIVGQLYITEALFLIIFPFILLRRNIRIHPKLRIIFALGALWFSNQVLTDIVRHTPQNDFLRGWAGILFLFIDIFVLYNLTKNREKHITAFLLGYAVGGLIVPFVQPSIYFQNYPWKFGFGQPVALLALLFIVKIRQNKLEKMRKGIWILAILGGLSFYLEARSLGATLIITAIIMWFKFVPIGRQIFAKLRTQNMILVGIILALSAWTILTGYSYAAQQKWLGEQEYRKYISQSTGAFGVVLGGRSEILAAGHAILDAPILGHGSWAHGAEYREYMYDITTLGYDVNRGYLSHLVQSSDLIPAHSHLTQAWVWAGVFGALFWGWVLVFIGKTFFRVQAMPNIFYPIIVFFVIASAWDILFSPYGATMRMAWATRFMIFLTVWQNRR